MIIKVDEKRKLGKSEAVVTVLETNIDMENCLISCDEELVQITRSLKKRFKVTGYAYLSDYNDELLLRIEGVPNEINLIVIGEKYRKYN